MVEEPSEPKPEEGQFTEIPTTETLDKHLKAKLKDYNLLSGEARRALRTAQFFHLQVETSREPKDHRSERSSY